MADAPPFAKLVPGFDFLQNLVKNAGSALPNIGQWVAPTLDPEELEKRIEELRTVQFWLEQNARMLGATIQALEVQRMTLSTLKTMNVQMTDLRNAMTLKAPDLPATAAPTQPPATASVEPPMPSKPAPAAKKKVRGKASSEGSDAGATTAALPAGVVDPMQWWSALTRQFTTLATNALKDGAGDAAKNLAGAMVRQSLDSTGTGLQKAATQAPTRAARKRPASKAKASPSS